MDLKRHKLAALGAAGGVLTLGAAVLGGTALAQTGGSGATPSPTPNAAQQERQAQRQAQTDTVLNDLAKNLGVDRTKLDSALKTTAKDQVDAAVTSGKLTPAQATQIKQSIDSGTAPLGFGFPGDFGGPGHGGPGHGSPEIPANVRQAAQSAVSQALGGETADQIRQDLQSGKTFDQIAQAHNTTVAAVQSAVVSAVQPLLDQAVTAGTITATQEQQVLDGIKNGMGFGLGFGPGRGHGSRPINGAPGTPPTSSTTTQ